MRTERRCNPLYKYECAVFDSWTGLNRLGSILIGIGIGIVGGSCMYTSVKDHQHAAEME